jgi:hypothetical protein
MLVPSETQCLLENISLGQTDALSAHRLFRTVLSLSQPFNARNAVEYFFKILRIEMKNYSHHLDNGNVLNQTSMDIGPFIANLLDEI